MTPVSPKKWRPTLTMIALAVLVSVLLLPLAGLIFFRLYENHLIRQTETELISQSAVIAAVMTNEILQSPEKNLPVGKTISKPVSKRSPERFHPITAGLDLASDPILPPRPDPQRTQRVAHPEYRRIGAYLTPILDEAQKTTLAGFRVVDFQGTVVAGGGDVGWSFAGLREVEAALDGTYMSVFRQRSSIKSVASDSISRATGIRVFTALPVMVKNQVVGAVYASRTPSNIWQQFNRHKQRVFLVGLILIGITFGIAYIFSRFIAGPIHELTRRTALIGSGDRSAIRPLSRNGSREIVDLADSFLGMASKLFDRSDYISNFATHVTHELKSPLTSIRGAVELLQDSDENMSADERRKFLNNIEGDAARMTDLLDRLRALSRAENPKLPGTTALLPLVQKLRAGNDGVLVELVGDETLVLPMAEENALIVFENLVENATNNGARRVKLVIERDREGTVVVVQDDGAGVSKRNADKIFDLFFTTRREKGGTGMGLGIVRAMLEAHEGSIALRPCDGGAAFEIRFRTSKM